MATILFNSSQKIVSVLEVTEFSCFSIKALVLERFFRPWLYPDFIYNNTAKGKRFKEFVRTAHDFTSSVSVQ
jgi:hypothetical protein